MKLTRPTPIKRQPDVQHVLALAREVTSKLQPTSSTCNGDPSTWHRYSGGWPAWLVNPSPENLNEWNTLDRWLTASGLRHGSMERDEAEDKICQLLGIDFYWSIWPYGGCISSLIHWDVKATKYLKLAEMSVLLDHISTLLGYDSLDYIDEDEPLAYYPPDLTQKFYFNSESRKICKGYNSAKQLPGATRSSQRGPQQRLEDASVPSPNLRDPVHGSSLPTLEKRTPTKSTGLTPAEIRRRRFRAINRR